LILFVSTKYSICVYLITHLRKASNLEYQSDHKLGDAQYTDRDIINVFVRSANCLNIKPNIEYEIDKNGDCG